MNGGGACVGDVGVGALGFGVAGERRRERGRVVLCRERLCGIMV